MTVKTLADLPWRGANDTPVWLKPRRTVYFVVRRVGGQWVELEDRRGRGRRFRSLAGAVRMAARLNQQQEEA